MKLKSYEAPLSELLFVLLPLLVLVLILVFDKLTLIEALISPEIPFATCILMGQALLKYFHSMLKRDRVESERVILIASLILIFGVVSAFIDLGLTLHMENMDNLRTTQFPRDFFGLNATQTQRTFPIRFALLVGQLLLFSASIIMFLKFGALKEELENKPKPNKEVPEAASDAVVQDHEE